MKRNNISTSDSPSGFVADLLKMEIPDVTNGLDKMTFENYDDLLNEYRRRWYQIATDKYLLNKQTQAFIPQARLLLLRAQKVVTNVNFEKMTAATAEGLWLQYFERQALNLRLKTIFKEKTNKDTFNKIKAQICDIYGFNEQQIEMLRYFVCQCKRTETDPALNRSLYLWSAEKMTGKTTIAKIIAGILNGFTTWNETESNAGDFMADIPNELQFETFARPKATRFNCVIMDEAFAGKTTAKYYGRFKSALTSNKCDVQIKFGSTHTIKASRNYIFTSNNDISSVVADETERRLFSIEIKKPKQLQYSQLFEIWFNFIVNCPDETDVVKWYIETAQNIKGDKGIQIDDLTSALLSEDCRQRVTDKQALGHYQLAFPHFFTQYLTSVFDVKSKAEVVKSAIVAAFGEPKQSGTRKYYNISDVLNILSVNLENSDTEPIYQNFYDTEKNTNDDLPY